MGLMLEKSIFTELLELPSPIIDRGIVDTSYLGCFLWPDLFGVFKNSKFALLTKMLASHDTSSAGLSREKVLP
jgi:hypothetical protein